MHGIRPPLLHMLSPRTEEQLYFFPFRLFSRLRWNYNFILFREFVWRTRKGDWNETTVLLKSRVSEHTALRCDWWEWCESNFISTKTFFSI